MKIILTTWLIAIITIITHAQPNCNVYKMKGNEICYEACVLATGAEAMQGHRDSQISFDKAIEMCPDFD